MNILFICHKVPYPPDKGEKIRAFHIIKHLSRRHRIFLYCLSGNKDDLKYKDELKKYCFSVNIYPVRIFFSLLRSAAYLFTKHPLTLAYFFSFRMKEDIRKILDNEPIGAIIAYCSSSAQYAVDAKAKLKIIDFVDIDSDKWDNFAKISRFPLSLIYKLESGRLRKWEKRLSEIYDASIVTTEKEKEKLEIIDPAGKDKISVVPNGVDLDSKAQGGHSRSSFIIFTGQMDYLPNVDAVIYFYQKILSLIKKEIPDIQFYIVGRNPVRSIRILCKEAIITGEVEELGGYLARASVYVAPFRISFGISNKVLQAMASGLPVVATSKVLEGIKACPGKNILIGDTPQEFARKTIGLLQDAAMYDYISGNARDFIKDSHDWGKNLEVIDSILRRVK